jgi:hypothetical protein
MSSRSSWFPLKAFLKKKKITFQEPPPEDSELEIKALVSDAAAALGDSGEGEDSSDLVELELGEGNGNSEGLAKVEEPAKSCLQSPMCGLLFMIAAGVLYVLPFFFFFFSYIIFEL